MNIEVNPMLVTAIQSLEAMERVTHNNPEMSFGWFYGSRGSDAEGYSDTADGEEALLEYSVAIIEDRPWILSREPYKGEWTPHLISQHDF